MSESTRKRSHSTFKKNTSLRICSLLPSSTEILFALGLGDAVVGVTHECDYPAEARTEIFPFDFPKQRYDGSAEVRQPLSVISLDC